MDCIIISMTTVFNVLTSFCMSIIFLGHFINCSCMPPLLLGICSHNLETYSTVLCGKNNHHLSRHKIARMTVMNGLTQVQCVFDKILNNIPIHEASFKSSTTHFSLSLSLDSPHLIYWRLCNYSISNFLQFGSLWNCINYHYIINMLVLSYISTPSVVRFLLWIKIVSCHSCIKVEALYSLVASILTSIFIFTCDMDTVCPSVTSFVQVVTYSTRSFPKLSYVFQYEHWIYYSKN